jgi:CheY-like chemotaxis protein
LVTIANNGREALAALRGFGCRVPAWIITGETDPSRIAEIRAAGVPVIYKPVDGLQLAAMLRGALERST